MNAGLSDIAGELPEDSEWGRNVLVPAVPFPFPFPFLGGTATSNAYDVLVLGGSGVDTIVYVPELPLPYADSYVIRPGIDARAGQTGDFVALGPSSLGLRRAGPGLPPGPRHRLHRGAAARRHQAQEWCDRTLPVRHPLRSAARRCG